MKVHMLYEDFDDAKRLKLFNIDSSQDQEIKRKDLQIILYMLKESLKNVAKARFGLKRLKFSNIL